MPRTYLLLCLQSHLAECSGICINNTEIRSARVCSESCICLTLYAHSHSTADAKGQEIAHKCQSYSVVYRSDIWQRNRRCRRRWQHHINHKTHSVQEIRSEMSQTVLHFRCGRNPGNIMCKRGRWKGQERQNSQTKRQNENRTAKNRQFQCSVWFTKRPQNCQSPAHNHTQKTTGFKGQECSYITVCVCVCWYVHKKSKV